jgi:hypothetical protein
MSSLDMVAYINATRATGEPELLHKNFMAKVPSVIKAAAKFLATAFYTVNGATRTRDIYNFPEEESMFMAMSYSYELQQTVYRAWKEAEAKLAAQVPAVAALPTTYLDALKQLVASVEVNQHQPPRLLCSRHQKPCRASKQCRRWRLSK